MKKIFMVIASLIASATLGLAARDLVILHTNDTHSQILPDADGRGGVLQRKAIVDSVRKAEKNVLLVDAGDRVQGSLYFKFFKGDVDYPLQNLMGVDIAVLGNHEFDNGMEALASHEATLKAERLSSNYDFSGTPAEGLFKPYTIRNYDGRKIGFIGVNIDPESLIAASTCQGVKFADVIETSDYYARLLKKEKKCDLVVAVTHIGYDKSNDKTCDLELARESEFIDVIIGGHSHTVVDPANPEKTPHVVSNAKGRPVLVAQTGKGGRFIGRIGIDLTRLPSLTPADFDYSLIPVTDRFPDSAFDSEMRSFLLPFTQKLDSVSNDVVGYASSDLSNRHWQGSFQNWTADFADWYGNLKLDSLRAADPDVPRLDFAIMNAGGIRNSIPKGRVTKGQLMNAFPFSNKFVIMEISGADILETLRIAASQGGQPVSSGVRVVTDADRNMTSALIGMEEIDPERTYIVATIDYLAWGNDDLRPLANGKWIFSDDVELCVPVIRYVSHLSDLGLPMEADPAPRFVKDVRLLF